MWHEVLPVAGGRQALRGADPLTLRFRLCLSAYICPGGSSSAVIQRTLTGRARAVGLVFFLYLCTPHWSGPVEGRPPPPTSHRPTPARAENFSQQSEQTRPMPQ